MQQVHAIALLDLRLCNTDRHGGNILLGSDSSENSECEDDCISEAAANARLVPIDHGYALPAYPELGEMWFEWMMWPQSKQPLSEETKNYVLSLNSEEDAEMARNMGLREESVKTLLIGTTLVQAGARNGLTPHEMGKIACRMEGPTIPSLLERMCVQVEEDLGPSACVHDFCKQLASVMDTEMNGMAGRER